MLMGSHFLPSLALLLLHLRSAPCTPLPSTKSDESSTSDGLGIPDIYDPLYKDQRWYMSEEDDNHRSPGLPSLHFEMVWGLGYTGRGVTVLVVDDGVHADNPEISPNFDKSLSLNVLTNEIDPTPPDKTSHGTQCAGVIAAAKNDGCGVGVAYEVNITGVAMPFGKQDVTDEMESRALSHSLEKVDIYCNSWGPSEMSSILGGMGPKTAAAVESGRQKGRGNKGAIYVWAGGNGGISENNCAYDGYVNSRYTIPVSGVSATGRKLRTTEQCSAVMIAVYAGDGSGNNPSDKMVTTDNAEGECTEKFGDSSAATAIVAGAMALTLQAKPIPDTITAKVPQSSNVHFIDIVEVYVDLNFTYRGHVGLTLVSPSGTRSVMLPGRYQDVRSRSLNWTVVSVAFWGESAMAGNQEWKLEFTHPFLGRDRTNCSGFLLNWELRLHGFISAPEIPSIPDPPTGFLSERGLQSGERALYDEDHGGDSNAEGDIQLAKQTDREHGAGDSGKGDGQHGFDNQGEGDKQKAEETGFLSEKRWLSLDRPGEIAPNDDEHGGDSNAEGDIQLAKQTGDMRHYDDDNDVGNIKLGQLTDGKERGGDNDAKGDILIAILASCIGVAIVVLVVLVVKLKKRKDKKNKRVSTGQPIIENTEALSKIRDENISVDMKCSPDIFHSQTSVLPMHCKSHISMIL